jgi:hypothetical protein
MGPSTLKKLLRGFLAYSETFRVVIFYLYPHHKCYKCVFWRKRRVFTPFFIVIFKTFFVVTTGIAKILFLNYHSIGNIVVCQRLRHHNFFIDVVISFLNLISTCTTHISNIFITKSCLYPISNKIMSKAIWN